MYFDYPLEQGLRLVVARVNEQFFWYFDYPLEQGLRRIIGTLGVDNLYFDYPLEQGLRHHICIHSYKFYLVF